MYVGAIWEFGSETHLSQETEKNAETGIALTKWLIKHQEKNLGGDDDDDDDDGFQISILWLTK